MKLPSYTSGPARHLGRLCAAWVFSISIAVAAPQGDPKEPYWQSSVPGIPIGRGVRLGGTWHERTPTPPPSLKDFKAKIERERIQWELERDQRQDLIGLWVKLGGMAIIMLAAVGHFATSFPPLKSMASSIASVGVGVYVLGLLIQKEAIYGRVIDWILFSMLILFIMFILYRYRDKSISHLFNKKVKRK